MKLWANNLKFLTCRSRSNSQVFDNSLANKIICERDGYDNDRFECKLSRKHLRLVQLLFSLLPDDIMKHVAANLVVGTRHLESPSTLLSRRTNELLVGEGFLTLRRTSRQINNKKVRKFNPRGSRLRDKHIFAVRLLFEHDR